LAEIILEGGRGGGQVCSNEGEDPSPRENNYTTEYNNTLEFLKYLLLQNQQANFNQPLYKSSLSKENSGLFK
jgi:hypothetical protein